MMVTPEVLLVIVQLCSLDQVKDKKQCIESKISCVKEKFKPIYTILLDYNYIKTRESEALIACIKESK